MAEVTPGATGASSASTEVKSSTPPPTEILSQAGEAGEKGGPDSKPGGQSEKAGQDVRALVSENPTNLHATLLKLKDNYGKSSLDREETNGGDQPAKEQVRVVDQAGEEDDEEGDDSETSESPKNEAGPTPSKDKAEPEGVVDQADEQIAEPTNTEEAGTSDQRDTPQTDTEEAQIEQQAGTDQKSEGASPKGGSDAIKNNFDTDPTIIRPSENLTDNSEIEELGKEKEVGEEKPTEPTGETSEQQRQRELKEKFDEGFKLHKMLKNAGISQEAADKLANKALEDPQFAKGLNDAFSEQGEMPQSVKEAVQSGDTTAAEKALSEEQQTKENNKQMAELGYDLAKLGLADDQAEGMKNILAENPEFAKNLHDALRSENAGQGVAELAKTTAEAAGKEKDPEKKNILLEALKILGMVVVMIAVGALSASTAAAKETAKHN